MSVEELLTRRFLMIADYPNNPANVGDIFTQIEGRTACSNGKGAISISELEKCTANFRELEWWEFRTPEDMPQFVKAPNGRIKEVYHWNHGNSTFVALETMMAITVRIFLPATEAEYLAQQSKA